MSTFNHRPHAVGANDVDDLCGSDAVPTARTKVFAAMAVGAAARNRQAGAVAGVVAARDAYAALVAVDLDFVDAVDMVDDPFKQAVRRRGVRPSVLIGLGDDQADRLRYGLELLVVVRAAPTCVLHVQHGIRVHMCHLMNQCCNGVFERAVERACAYVDLMLALFAVDCPDFADAVMTICAGRALHGDNRLLKLSVEELIVEHAEQLFELTCEA